MKGAAATMMTIILLVIVLFFLVVFLTNAKTNGSLTQFINLRESDAAAAENTFSLLNRSLGITWYLFTTQSIYSVSDDSMKCGLDKADYGIDVNIPDGYWYYYDHNDNKKDVQSVNNFISNLNGNSDKYNTDEPHVCYPTDDNVIEILRGKFSELNESIPTRFKMNNFNIEIDQKNVPTDFNFMNDGVRTVSTQNVKISDKDVSVSGTTQIDDKIYTQFPKFATFGRNVVQYLVLLSDLFSDDTTTTPPFNDNVSGHERCKYSRHAGCIRR